MTLPPPTPPRSSGSPDASRRVRAPPLPSCSLRSWVRARQSHARAPDCAMRPAHESHAPSRNERACAKVAFRIIAERDLRCSTLINSAAQPLLACESKGARRGQCSTLLGRSSGVGLPRKSFGLRRLGGRRRPSRREVLVAASLRPPLNGRSDRDRSRFLPATRARSARCGRYLRRASRNADRDSFP